MPTLKELKWEGTSLIYKTNLNYPDTNLCLHRYDLIELARGNGSYGGNVGNIWDIVDQDGIISSNACFASEWYNNIKVSIHPYFIFLKTGTT